MIFRKVMLLAFVLSVVISGGRVSAQPTITGLDTIVFSPTNDPILTWKVSFSEAVTGVSPANFTVAGTGVSATIDSVTALPGNMAWNVSVNGITGDGTLGLNLTNPTGISGASGALVQTFTGEVYTVDNTSPAVVSIVRLDPSPTLATSVDFQINFSEPIYNLSIANFAPGGTPVGTVSDISATTNPAVWRGTISGISGSGRLSLDLTDTSSVTDDAGNWLFSDFTSGEQYEIPPQLLCISRLDAEITSATAVRYNIQFNVPVNGLSPTNFTATGPGGPLTNITVASASGSAPATDWVVTVGSITGDGIVQLTMQNPATILDGSGVSAINVNPLNCNDTTYQIDQSAPTAGCVVIATPASNATPTSATAVRFAVQFSDPVTGISVDNFAISTTDLTAYTTGTWTTADGGITWSLDITGISENTTNATNGQIAVSWANSNGIIDVAGNQPALPTACVPAYYDIDHRGAVLDCVTREPAGISEITSATQVSFLVTFSEAVQTSSVSAADFRVLFAPTAGLLSADVTTVTAVTTGSYSQQFVVDLANVVGNSALMPQFTYNGGQSIGNGQLSLRLAADAEIWDVAGNEVQPLAVLAASCGNTSYTLDQVNPVVDTIDFANGDCLTSGIFTLAFSEEVTTVSASDIEVLWNGGDCKGTFTVTQVLRTGPATFEVEVTGDYPIFHQNGPGEIGLRILANDAIRDVAGNSLVTDLNSGLFELCRCFEPVVTTSPLAVMVDTLRYPELTTGTVICSETDNCTSIGILTAPYNDTPTTISKPDVFAWNATEWDCHSTAPFALYLDEMLVGTTDGNTSLALATQLPPGTSNSLCSPIGTGFDYVSTATLSPGLHSFRVNLVGGCTSDTKMFFNVLDPPVLRFPMGGISSCRQPRVFGWEATAGAIGYDLFFVDASTSCSHFVGRTSTTELIVTDDLITSAGSYEWYVQAFNKYGHMASEHSTFTLVNASEAAEPNVFRTDGTIYDMVVTSSTTYLAGSFSLVKIGVDNYPASNIAAIDNLTSTVVPMPVVNNTVYTIEPDGNDLYIGGDFTRITDSSTTTAETLIARIARLKPDTSSTLVTSGSMRLDKRFMPGANDTVRAIEVVGQKVYYGGDFTKVGVQVYNFGTFEDQVDAVRLATAATTMTAESKPAPVSAGVDPNASVYDLLADDGYLYIAGAFSSIGGKAVHGLARTNIKADGVLDQGFDLNIAADVSHYVYSMEMLGNRLYFGGSFDSVMGQPRRNAANIEVSPTTSTVTLGRWDPQPHGGVYEVASRNDGVVYIGGTFTSMRNERFTYLAAVDSVIGYPLSCKFNADRVIYAVTFWENRLNGGVNIQVGGAATSAGL